MELGIPPPRTPDGRVYRFSPNENAHPRHFVLGDATRPESVSDEMRSRMKLDPGSSQTVCPYSGIIADDHEFTHPDDRQAAIDVVKHAALTDMEDEIARMFDGFNRRQSRNSMIRLEAKVTKRFRPRPRFYRGDLLRELECDHCGRDYGVYAIGLFCPDCGAPNVQLHFAREVELVDAQVTLADSLEPEKEELAYRLLGNAHEDVLTAFEATLKTVFFFGWASAHNNQPPPKIGNDFQNVERGQRRFAQLGLDPYSVLAPEELAKLKLNIQKRHVIGHNLGVVDAKFAEESGEASLGETVHLVAEDIRAFAHVAQKVVNALDAWIGGVPIPARTPEVSEAGPDATEDELSNPGAELGLSPLAFQVASWLAEQSDTGLALSVNSEVFEAAFEDASPVDLKDAIAELDADGYIATQSLVGRGLPRMRVRNELFATFDPLVLGSDPTLDAVELAKLCLEREGGISVPDLHEQTGWPLRQFNPALSILTSYVDDRRVSRSGDHQYPTRHFTLLPADRVAVKRFMARYP